MKITSVKAQILSTARLKGVEKYEDTAGLRFPEMSEIPPHSFSGRADKRHLCVYPSDRNTVLVRVEANNGLVGIGESHAPVAPRVVSTIIQDLFAPLLIGEDARQIDVLWERMFSAMRLRSHTQGFTLEAIAGIDIALWDLLGKHRGEPVWMMLGGAYRTRLPVYSSGIPGQNLEERLAAVETVLGQEFCALKTSCGRGTLGQEMELVRSLSGAIGVRGQLLVDAHGAFDLSDALQFARFLENLGNIGWLEDPLVPEDHQGYHELTRSTSLRIAMGETECNRYGVRDRLLRNECNILLPDVCRAGGISETLKMARLADIFGVGWASHVSMSTPIHLIAGLHVGAATQNFFISEFPHGFADGPFGNILLLNPVDCQDGTLTLGSEPGLGISLNEEEVQRLSYSL
ncbi:mandelate racemase/muconate lactonizing enzyme family protein [Candidatus Poribacteria bacterium]